MAMGTTAIATRPRHNPEVTVRAVVFDVGGVLERVHRDTAATIEAIRGLLIADDPNQSD
ncbi:MAG TPA: hypothetical protein VFT62_05435 [Mycobacteriales bacterium]|nr:hypothetical protein [Mycobacteriales bacterium]